MNVTSRTETFFSLLELSENEISAIQAALTTLAYEGHRTNRPDFPEYREVAKRLLGTIADGTDRPTKGEKDPDLKLEDMDDQDEDEDEGF